VEEISDEGYVSKRTILPMMMIMIFLDSQAVNQIENRWLSGTSAFTPAS
jgi:hypothetical protein